MFGLCFCGVGPLGSAIAVESPERTPAITLPAVIVSDTRDLPPPEHWRYAKMPGFEILSQASDARTQGLIGELTMFRQALNYAWPMRIGGGESTTLIICDGESRFDTFVPAGKSSPTMALASVFLKAGTRTAIVMDVAATTLHVTDTTTASDVLAGTDPTTISVDSVQQLYREYVRCLLSRAEPRLPAWFEEGLAQSVMKMEFDRRRIEIGRLEDPNAVSAEAAMKATIRSMTQDEERGFPKPRTGQPIPPEDLDDPKADASLVPAEDRGFQAALNERALLPLSAVFAVPHDAPETQNPLGANRWAKESYAFVHMCLYGYKGKYRKPFGALLARAARGPVTEAMFQDCFKASTEQMTDQLRDYCETAVYDWQEIRAKKGDRDLIAPPQPVALRDATDAEVGRLEGEALRLAGKKDLARNELVAPFVRHRTDSDLLAALGRFEHEDGHEDAAQKLLEAACAAKTKDSDAYLELARMRYAQAAAHATGDAKFVDPQATVILGLLRTARQFRPDRADTYELLADTWLRSPRLPERDDVFVLAEGVRLFPGELKLAYETAVLAGAIHELAVAHSLAEYGMGAARDPATKGRFERLKASLPPEPPSN